MAARSKMRFDAQPSPALLVLDGERVLEQQGQVRADVQLARLLVFRTRLRKAGRCSA